MKKSFCIITLGCRTNQYESQAIREQLQFLGCQEVSFEEADIYIINSCIVTHSAEKDTLQHIDKCFKKNPSCKLIVTGCICKKKNFDYRVKVISDKEKIASALFPDEKILPFSISKFKGHTRAFVKIQDGCNSFCSYCIIPYARGRSTVRKESRIVSEVKKLCKNGFKEIVLTGVNIGDYKDLSNLLLKLEQIEDLKRIRISSIDPTDLTKDLISVITSSKKVMPHLHLVLQSGSDKILKKMNGKYDTKLFLEKISDLRKKNENFSFSTDIIVGFPGETEEDFDSSFQMVRKVKFSNVHVFPYSRREGTYAAKFEELDPGVIQERKQKLLKETKKQAFLFRERFVGEILSILTEKGKGHTEHFLPVWLDDSFCPNQLIHVKILKNLSKGLVGHVIENDSYPK